MIPGAAASSTMQQLISNMPTVQNVTAAVTPFIENVTSSLAAANGAAANSTLANAAASVTDQLVQQIMPFLNAANASAANITASIAPLLAQAVVNMTSMVGANSTSVNATAASG